MVPAQLQQSPELLMGGGRLLRLSVASFCRNRRTSFKSSISCWSNICRSRSNFTARKKATPSSPACVHQMQAKDSGTPLQHSYGHQKELLMSSPFILKQQVHERQAGATFYTVFLHHNIPYKGHCLSSPQSGHCLSSPQYHLQGALKPRSTTGPNDRNGIENRHIAHFQFLVLFIKQLNI